MSASAARIVRCPACGRYYRISGAGHPPGVKMRCASCGTIFTPEPAPAAPAPAVPAAAATAAAAAPAAATAAPRGGRVLVATDGPEFISLISEVLAGEGHELREARGGEDAWAAIAGWRPHVALLDVALPGVPAFELCDRVRADPGLRATGIVLIASVFQQTRYKRAPTSLYGADDYIEKHHIRDWLPGKVARLIPAGAAAPAPPPPPEDRIAEREKQALIHEELFGGRHEPRPGTEADQGNLRRYARIIVSDIALYNEELVERGIREGSFHQLLGKELEEGRRLYLARVTPGAAGVDHFAEAVREFIAMRTAGGRARRGDS